MFRPRLIFLLRDSSAELGIEGLTLYLLLHLWRDRRTLRGGPTSIGALAGVTRYVAQ